MTSARNDQAMPALHHRTPWFVPVLYLFSAVAFGFDLVREITLAYGIVYIPLVASALFDPRRHSLWITTATACLLVVMGAWFPAVAFDLPDLIGNRVLSIIAILATAAIVHHARGMQDRLAGATQRAEAAEQIKTEVLANLSQDMRMPLHALLGLLNLILPGCRPDQQEALLRVRAGGRELLGSIDNLIDLTQIDERTLRRQQVNMMSIMQEAADYARDAAHEHDVAIRVMPPYQSNPVAVGDKWAVRRILDNLIANAIRLALPGGTVCVAVEQDQDSVMASVGDTGMGLSRDCLDRDADSFLPANGETGLTLSQRLATAMNGRLTVITRDGFGATVSLLLPVA